MPESERQGYNVEPMRDRPYLPDGYGIPESEEGMLPWDHVTKRLEEARNYWVATTRPDGSPHVIPIWGASIDGAVYFEGGSTTRWGRNLATNPRVVVHLESGDDVVIVHGTAEPAVDLDPTIASRIADSYGAKYAYTPDPENWSSGGLYVVRPRVVLAWSKFPEDATRWRFGAE